MHWLRPAERMARNDHIVDLYRKGLSLDQISTRVGLNKSTVCTILKKRGVERVHDYPSNAL